MLLAPGTRLGPYEIESLIGSEGMGEVYKAHDGRLNRTVAIKRMIANDDSRFQSEARAIAAINHPHICQIYDVGPDYLVLEYLQGEVLRGPVTGDDAGRLASQIADALHAAQRTRHSSPRSEAGQCHGPSAKRSPTRQAARRDPDGSRRCGWDTSVHVPGTGGRQAARRAIGRVQLRRR